MRHIGFFAVVVTALFGSLSSAGVIYVDDDAQPGGDGSTWESAFMYLQDALAIATDADEIRIAQGTYRPDDSEHGHATPGDRSATFELVVGAEVYGGYRGCPGGDCLSGDPDERDTALYATILSGDLAGDDGPSLLRELAACYSGEDVSPEAGCEAFDLDGDDDVDGDDVAAFLAANQYAENAYHVATGSGVDLTTILDGVTITAGNADGSPSFYDCGGGLLVVTGSPTVTDCRFTGNHGVYGASLLAYDGSSVELTGCTFERNIGRFGGGINCRASAPELTECAFVENVSVVDGGGMINLEGAEPTLTGCLFEGNRAQHGGALANWSGSRPDLQQCTITRNVATLVGGGLYSNDASPNLMDCTLTLNRAAEWGGAIDNVAGANATISACLFEDNRARYGGAINNTSSSPTCENCQFYTNHADSCGGAVNSDGTCAPSFADCTFGLNLAVYGGAVTNWNDANGRYTACTFDSNRAVLKGGAMDNALGASTVTECTFSGNHAEVDGGGIAFRESSGTTITGCTFDRNSARISGGGICADTDSVFALAGCTFTANMAEGTGGSGIACLLGCHAEIRDCTISNSRGAALYGGGIYCANSSPLIVGCVIDANTCREGGGIACESGSSPTIIDCLICNNDARMGGGLWIGGGQPYIAGCVISGNVGEYGGALSIGSTFGLTMVDCVISGNEANQGGAAAWLSRARLHSVNCTIADNTGVEGAAVFCRDRADADFINCVFAGHTNCCIHEDDTDSDARVRQCHFGDHPGGVCFDADLGMALATAAEADAALTDWSDNSDGDPQFVAGAVGTWTAPPSYNAATNRTTLTDAAGGFGSSPLAGRLINPSTDQLRQALITANTSTTVEVAGDVRGLTAEGSAYALIDYHLAAGSPCIDAGTNIAPARDKRDLDNDGCTTDPVPLDVEGKYRYRDDPETPDTGVGQAPIVDQGAYEFESTAFIPSGPCPGDCNCDGQVDYGDIDAFVAALTGEAGYLAQYPACIWLNADCDNDGHVNYEDIDAFVALLSS